MSSPTTASPMVDSLLLQMTALALGSDVESIGDYLNRFNISVQSLWAIESHPSNYGVTEKPHFTYRADRDMFSELTSHFECAVNGNSATLEYIQVTNDPHFNEAVVLESVYDELCYSSHEAHDSGKQLYYKEHKGDVALFFVMENAAIESPAITSKPLTEDLIHMELSVDDFAGEDEFLDAFRFDYYPDAGIKWINSFIKSESVSMLQKALRYDNNSSATIMKTLRERFSHQAANEIYIKALKMVLPDSFQRNPRSQFAADLHLALESYNVEQLLVDHSEIKSIEYDINPIDPNKTHIKLLLTDNVHYALIENEDISIKRLDHGRYTGGNSSKLYGLHPILLRTIVGQQAMITNQLTGRIDRQPKVTIVGSPTINHMANLND